MSYRYQLNVLHIIIPTHLVYIFCEIYLKILKWLLYLNFDKLPKTCLILRSCTFLAAQGALIALEKGQIWHVMTCLLAGPTSALGAIYGRF